MLRGATLPPRWHHHTTPTTRSPTHTTLTAVTVSTTHFSLWLAQHCVAQAAGSGLLDASGPRAASLCTGGLLLLAALTRLVMDWLSEPSKRRLMLLFWLLLRPLTALSSLLLRTPLAPVLLFVARLLRLTL